MRFEGAPSWGFASGTSQDALVLLFVRDSMGLRPSDGGNGPPPLDGEIPDLSHRLTVPERIAAAEDWPGLWRDLLVLEADQKLAPRDEDPGRWARQWLRRREAVFDAPEFVALAGRPALRRAVQAGYEAAREWSDGHRSDHPEHDEFSWSLLSSVAERIAADQGVSPDRVRGCALVVPVRGVWWARIEPGAVVCSTAATSDEPAEAIVTEAFSSGLTRS